jgi:hypothetical protein
MTNKLKSMKDEIEIYQIEKEDLAANLQVF